ncbi:MAG TPA: septum site-determining protein MinC [Anaerolineaceae bacterium]|nr:septum site-determining protein MinC [Anaerolineaceae bacterium]
MQIQIKGIRDGLLASLGEGDWPEVQTALLAHIEEQSSFFQGARLALDVGNRTLRAAELGSLRNVLSDRGVTLWAVISKAPATEQTAQVLGLATRLSTPRPERTVHTLETTVSGGEAGVWVQRTLRSGFKVETPGSVTVIGDVNPGAEISAGGSVVIWGHLRGSVHAGAQGDEAAVVCALDFYPTQLRIAQVAYQPPPKKGKPQPGQAHCANGEIIIELWKPKNK